MSNLKGYDGSVQGKVKFALHHLHSVECLTTVIYLYPELKKIKFQVSCYQYL